MSSWAVIKTGGKQYKVAEGEKLGIEKIDAAGKDTIQFNEVLLVKKNGTLEIGKPFVVNTRVNAKILKNFKDKKVRVVKFKSKSRYLRTRGHRQQKIKVLIEKISV